MTEALARWWAHLRGRRYGATMLTATGRRVHVLDMRPEDVNVADVARGLANECRYNGQISVELEGQIFYSVAEHSVLVSRAVVDRYHDLGGTSERMALALAREGLLHDGSEAYLGDVIRPLKYLPAMRPYRRWEARLQDAIFERFGVLQTTYSRTMVKAVDDAILADEASVRCGVSAVDYARRFGGPLAVPIRCLPPDEAELLWVDRFAELWPEEVEAAARLARR